jgi:hypothetical protein
MTDHDAEYRFDWYDSVAGIYADIVGDADPDEGIQREEAFEIASVRIHDAIDRGDLKPPVDEVVKVSLIRADEQHGKRADRIIRDTVQGAIAFNMIGDPALGTVVTLGKGRRKLWRDVNNEDLLAMDENRFQNAKAAQDSYAEWRTYFEPARRAVMKHGTVAAAIKAGAFGGESR